VSHFRLSIYFLFSNDRQKLQNNWYFGHTFLNGCILCWVYTQLVFLDRFDPTPPTTEPAPAPAPYNRVTHNLRGNRSGSPVPRHLCCSGIALPLLQLGNTERSDRLPRCTPPPPRPSWFQREMPPRCRFQLAAAWAPVTTGDAWSFDFNWLHHPSSDFNWRRHKIRLHPVAAQLRFQSTVGQDPIST
jgi:hypothetical protein